MKKYKHLEPIAKKAVDGATSKDQIYKMFSCIDGFITDDEALKLRDLLWYARDKGVEVIFVPLNLK